MASKLHDSIDFPPKFNSMARISPHNDSTVSLEESFPNNWPHSSRYSFFVIDNCNIYLIVFNGG